MISYKQLTNKVITSQYTAVLRINYQMNTKIKAKKKKYLESLK